MPHGDNQITSLLNKIILFFYLGSRIYSDFANIPKTFKASLETEVYVNDSKHILSDRHAHNFDFHTQKMDVFLVPVNRDHFDHPKEIFWCWNIAKACLIDVLFVKEWKVQLPFEFLSLAMLIDA